MHLVHSVSMIYSSIVAILDDRIGIYGVFCYILCEDLETLQTLL